MLLLWVLTSPPKLSGKFKSRTHCRVIDLLYLVLFPWRAESSSSQSRSSSLLHLFFRFLFGSCTIQHTNKSLSGQYKTIKKGFKPTNGDSTATTPSSGKTKTTKAKTPASASATKGRKRKVAEANINEDEEESALFTPKSQKIKKEADANGKAIGAALDGISSEVFKADEEGEGVDLENDVYVLLTPLVILQCQHFTASTTLPRSRSMMESGFLKVAVVETCQCSQVVLISTKVCLDFSRLC